MPISLLIETLVYYICLIIILVKILDGVLKRLPITLSFLIYIPISIFWSFINESMQVLIMITIFIFEIIILKTLFKNVKLCEIAYSFLILFCFNAIINYTVLSFFNLSNHNRIILEFIVHFASVIICIILCYSKTQIKIKNIIQWLPKRIKLLILLLAFTCMLSVALMLNLRQHISNEPIINFTFKVLLFLVLFVFITFPIMILNATTNTYLKKLTHDYEEQIKAQAEHYSALAKANFELRRFQHDFKNIKVGVSKLIAEERLTETINMLDSTNEDIYNITNSLLCFDTGNGIVDALLAEKQRNAALSNIKIKFEGAVPSSSISATELCVLFGNTIDNAIEACEKIDIENEKIINITCKCNSNFMFLDITNPVSKPIVIKNNTLATTKADKTLHGFGLYSLDQIVRKHDGELNLSCDNYEFKVNINMFVET